MGKYLYIEILDRTGEAIALYTSTKQACTVTNINPGTLQKVIKESGQYHCCSRQTTLYPADKNTEYYLKPIDEEKDI